MIEKILEIILIGTIVPLGTALIKARLDIKKLSVEFKEKEIEANKDLKMAEIKPYCVDTPRLKEHHFFNSMMCLKDTILISFEIPNKGKEEVFKELLTVKIEVFTKIFTELVDELDDLQESGKLSDSVVREKFMEAVRKGVKQYTSFYNDPKYTDDERTVFAIVIPKFNRWHIERIQQTEQGIINTCSSVFFPQPKMKAVVILERLYATFLDTVQDAENTLNELNGDLSGLTFHGIEI